VSIPAFFARWRVRAGYPLAVIVLWLARPTPGSILAGASIGAVGLLMRAWAAGYLHKQKVLTRNGPYAHTRNPLYFGSAILALGVGVATHSWVAVALLCAYFALFYSVVMKREEDELQLQHGSAFAEYAKTVPLFWPRLSAGVADADHHRFSFEQYKKNREYRAAVGFLLLLGVFVLIWGARQNWRYRVIAFDETTGLQSVAVSEYVNRAVAIGTQRRYACAAKTFEQDRAGMAVGIVFSRRDDRQARMHRVQEFWHRGIFAAVMTNFQNIGLQRFGAVLSEHRPLGVFFGVARKQNAAIAVAQPQYQRVAVFC
jgi:protein-S-isoprenylcysteine O-methyltransferase Ste14